MIKWLFPRPGDSFLGWIGRIVLIFGSIFSVGALAVFIEEKFKPETSPPYEWIGLDPSRPASDISHRDYINGIVYYREYNDPGPYVKKYNDNTTELIGGKYTAEDIEDIFIENDLANDYEYLYEMFRD